MMDFDEYQYRATRTAIYPDAGTGSALALAYVGLGLGEAGEVQGKIKKVLRDNGGVLTQEARETISDELGDLLWYVAQACREIGVPMKLVAHDNIEKLADRAARGVLQGSGDSR